MAEKNDRSGSLLGDFSISQLLATALAAATSFALSTQIGIAWDEGAPVEFEIQLSSGGGLFVPVWRGKSRLNNGTMETYTFDGATSSDLRILILSEEGRIKEVKLDEL